MDHRFRLEKGTRVIDPDRLYPNFYAKTGQPRLNRCGWPVSFSMIKRQVHQPLSDIKKTLYGKEKTDNEKIEKSTAIQ